MQTLTQTNSTTNFSYTTNTNLGGFIIYWKLYFSLIKSIYVNPFFSKMKKAELFNEWISLKGLWYLFLKPFGVIFSYKVTLKGKKEIKRGVENLSVVKGKKIFILYLFRLIPIFLFVKHFSKKDIENILNRGR